MSDLPSVEPWVIMFPNAPRVAAWRSGGTILTLPYGPAPRVVLLANKPPIEETLDCGPVEERDTSDDMATVTAEGLVSRNIVQNSRNHSGAYAPC